MRAAADRAYLILNYDQEILGTDTYDHRSARTGHPVQNSPFSPSLTVRESKCVVLCMLWKSRLPANSPLFDVRKVPTLAISHNF